MNSLLILTLTLLTLGALNPPIIFWGLWWAPLGIILITSWLVNFLGRPLLTKLCNGRLIGNTLAKSKLSIFYLLRKVCAIEPHLVVFSFTLWGTGQRQSEESFMKEAVYVIRRCLIKFVKEQRVDDSKFWLMRCKLSQDLRCTLMGFERNWGVVSNTPLSFNTVSGAGCYGSPYWKNQIKIPIKQLNCKKFSTLSNNRVNPWFLTGFSDAESSFIVSITKNEKSKLKWRVSLYFSIHIHLKDIALLKLVQNTLGVGVVRQNSDRTVLFRVSSLEELQVIINHFDSYPLISAKYCDYLLFKQCYNLIKNKEHLTQEGFERLLALKYNLNKGLPEELRNVFSDVIPVLRPEYIFKAIPHPYWISGFASGDSSFIVSLEKSTTKVGIRVRLIFGTYLHLRDKDLSKGIGNYIKSMVWSGENSLSANSKDVNIYCSESKQTCLLQIKNQTDIEEKVLPFFDKYPIEGVKKLDYEDFKKVAELIKNKEHLSLEGITKIKEIAEGMNLDRK